MSQVSSTSHNEFVFGEKGGRGKNLLSFLKNLSLTGQLSKPDHSDEGIRQINSSIYGDMTYGYTSPDTGGLVLPKAATFQKGGGAAAAKGRRLRLQPLFPYGNSKSRPLGDQIIAQNGSVASLGTALGGSGASNPLFASAVPSRTPSRLALPLFRHATSSLSALDSSLSRLSRLKVYEDLDDDWDAQIDDVEDPYGRDVREELLPQSHLQPDMPNRSVPTLIDLLHPELTSYDSFSSQQQLVSLERSCSRQRALIDSHDMQAKLEVQRINQMQSKLAKFQRVLLDNDGTVNLRDLRKLAWNGIPPELRASVWQLLIGYLPANRGRQTAILHRKRTEYAEGLKNVSTQILFVDDTVIGTASLAASASNSSNKDNPLSKDKLLYHQIKIDVKRTNPSLPLYAHVATQLSLKKILYLWAVRHPASGYVQGINDLVTPFYQIFLGNYIWQLQKEAAILAGGIDNLALFIPGLLVGDDSVEKDEQEEKLLADPALMTYTAETFDPSLLSARVTSHLEADTYWCLTRLLENITDNYIHEQPGILRQVGDLRILILKIDPELLNHFEAEGVEFIQFLFRWMNCLLMREMTVELVIRMWDTYLSETPQGFNLFHVYVCAAFLIKFSAELKEKDFQDILLFLQSPPTTNWTEKDIEVMLSEAFIWQSLYVNAGAHLR